MYNFVMSYSGYMNHNDALSINSSDSESIERMETAILLYGKKEAVEYAKNSMNKFKKSLRRK